MPRYMLDTDTCSYVVKRTSDALVQRLRMTCSLRLMLIVSVRR